MVRNKVVLVLHPIRKESYQQDVARTRTIMSRIRAEKRYGKHQSIPMAPHLLHAEVLHDIRKLTAYCCGQTRSRDFSDRVRYRAVWAYGNEITTLMRVYMLEAVRMGIPVIAKSEAMRKLLKQIKKKRKTNVSLRPLALAA